MKYFKYEEVIINNQVYILDSLSYGSYIEEYISSISNDNGLRTYIVKIDLDDNDMAALIKKQKVSLVEITKDQYFILQSESEDYKQKRCLAKLLRDNEIEENIVFFNKRGYDANEASIARMNNKLSQYNYMFNRLLGNGSSYEEAYKVYDEIIQWKDSSNEIVEISIHNLATIHQLAINKLELCMLTK